MKNKNKNKKGFLVLIAIVVSVILLSVGMFIANVALQEIKISSSLKESQKAFYAADSILECALLKEFTGNGFARFDYNGVHNIDNSLSCGDYNFDWDESYDLGNGITKHIYYISLYPNLVDTDSNHILSKDEIENLLQSKKSPYVKLLVFEKQDPEDVAPNEWITKLEAYGHNKMSGSGVIERAIEISW